MKVTDRVVLITGASSGVGAALASKLSAMGARVVVNYSRSAEAAEAVVAQVLAAGGQAIAIQADVSEEADCKRLVAATIEHFGQLDMLVNNAGTTTFVPHDRTRRADRRDLAQDLTRESDWRLYDVARSCNAYRGGGRGRDRDDLEHREYHRRRKLHCLLCLKGGHEQSHSHPCENPW